MELAFKNPVEPGTVLYMDYHSGRFLSVVHNQAWWDTSNTLPEDPPTAYDVELDYATPEQMQALSQRTEPPRSITEHMAIPRQWTVYGLARVQGANGLKPSPVPRKHG